MIPWPDFVPVIMAFAANVKCARPAPILALELRMIITIIMAQQAGDT